MVSGKNIYLQNLIVTLSICLTSNVAYSQSVCLLLMILPPGHKALPVQSTTPTKLTTQFMEMQTSSKLKANYVCHWCDTLNAKVIIELFLSWSR